MGAEFGSTGAKFDSTGANLGGLRLNLCQRPLNLSRWLLNSDMRRPAAAEFGLLGAIFGSTAA